MWDGFRKFSRYKTKRYSRILYHRRTKKKFIIHYLNLLNEKKYKITETTKSWATIKTFNFRDYYMGDFQNKKVREILLLQ